MIHRPLRVLLLVLIAAAPAWAGVPSAPVAEPPETLAFETRLKADTSYVFESNFETGNYGKQSAWQGQFDLTLAIPVGGSWRFLAGAGYERFEFSGSTAPLPDNLQALYANLGVEYIIAGKTAFKLSARPGFSYGEDFDGDGFDIPALGFFGFPLSKSFILTVGAMYSRWHDYPVLPVAGFIWDINDRISVFAIPPEPGIRYKVSEDLTISVKGGMLGGVFQTGDLPGKYANTQLEYIDLRAGAGVSYCGFKPFTIDLDCGWSFLRRFQYEDVGGRFEPDAAPYVRIGVGATF